LAIDNKQNLLSRAVEKNPIANYYLPIGNYQLPKSSATLGNRVPHITPEML
jgi:hypothetical protein